MSTNDERLRREILEIFNAQDERAQNSIWVTARVSRDRLYEALDIPKDKIDSVIYNLAARGLIDIDRSIWDDKWINAEITEKGIEYLESSQREDIIKPATPSSHQTIHIHGGVRGPVSQTLGGDTYNITNILEAINHARALVEDSESIEDDDKEEVLEHLEIIEDEINSDYPDKEVITDSWDWLKTYGPQFVISVLSGLITGWILGR